MAPPTSAAQARLVGSRVYLSDNPCKHGHVGFRYTSSQSCVECSKARYLANYSSQEAKDEKNNKARERYQASEDVRDRIRKKLAERRIGPEFRNSVNEKLREKRANDPHYREATNQYLRIYNSDPERKRIRKEKDAAKYAAAKAADPDFGKDRKDYHRSYMRDRIANDPKFRLNMSVSAGVRRGLKSGKGGNGWQSLVGYTLEALRNHLEAKFLPGMTWENYGKWHVDHIVPLSAHNFEAPEDPDFRRAWALDNLQPMWAIDNIKKGARLDADFQPSLRLVAPQET